MINFLLIRTSFGGTDQKLTKIHKIAVNYGKMEGGLQNGWPIKT
jgi:hypothetical protein